MDSHPEVRPGIREQRAKRADGGGSALNTEPEMSVQKSGNSLMISLTAYAVSTHNITTEDAFDVETHVDGIWIPMWEGAER